ncbi:MAG: glycoside hydrolase family 3 N-terminal domain-containing protein, partial [Nitrososphaerota archaeon]
MREGLFLQIGIYGKDKARSKEIITKIKPGSIILMERDFTGLDSIRDLIRWIFEIYDKELKIERPTIAIDQEGGNVVRIRDLDYPPSNYALGVLGSKVISRYSGMLTGNQLYSLGIEWNLAPVLDTLSNTANPIVMERSFGSDPDLVSDLGESYIEGIQSAGVSATAKHFPGHGFVKEDSHLELPVDTRDKESVMNGSKPFSRAIRAGVKSIMVSHVKFEKLDPDFPASLSQNIIGLLRNDLGFGNVIITDSLDMKAITSNYSVSEFTKLAYGAGADVLECVDPELAIEVYDSLKSVALDGTHERARRIENLRCQITANYKPPNEVMNWISAQAVRWLRKKNLRADKRIAIVPLRSMGNIKEWPHAMYSKVCSHLAKLGIDCYVKYMDEDWNFSNDDIILFGKNLHLNENWKRVNELAKENNCCFVSIGVPVDKDLIDPRVGY